MPRLSRRTAAPSLNKLQIATNPFLQLLSAITARKLSATTALSECFRLAKDFLDEFGSWKSYLGRLFKTTDSLVLRCDIPLSQAADDGQWGRTLVCRGFHSRELSPWVD